MVEVFKVVTGVLSTSYHGSKEAALRRAERDVMRYSKHSDPNVYYISRVYRAKLSGEDPDAIADDLQTGTGRWRWPECHDLIAKQSSKDGGVTYRYDEEEDEDTCIGMMRRAFLDYLDTLETTGRKMSVDCYVNILHAIAKLYKPIIPKTLYEGVMEADEDTPVQELSEMGDSLSIDCHMPLDESKVLAVAYNVLSVEGCLLEQRALALKLLKAILDARKG